LIVIGFDHKRDADDALWRVGNAAERRLLDIHDTAVVVRDEAGRASYSTTVPVPGAGTGAGMGALWGLLLGLLFAPLTAGASTAAGVVALAAGTGAVGGALYGGVSKEDFDASFLTALEAEMRPGTSALVLLLDGVHASTERILEEVRPPRGRVIRTNLSPATEAKLRAALAGVV
jgi:uncharacterized membrane protein